MAPVSVPEKTLEHWASMYLTYRFRSKASLWWPTRGEDIDIRDFPGLPGKAVQLEVKTTTPGGNGSQVVKVDLGQLWDYSRRPLKDQPFYVFPQPHWSGNLERAARGAGIAVTELAFSRSGAPWWFAGWMQVMTTREVAAVVAADLAAHGCPARGNVQRLVRFNVGPGAVHEWGARANPVATPATMAWRDFWAQLTNCGDAAWPQTIRLPRASLAAGPTHRLFDLRRALTVLAAQAADDGTDFTQGQFNDLVSLAPNNDGQFEVVPEPEEEVQEAGDEPDDALGDLEDFPDRRQAVFLDARAIATQN